LSDDAQQSEPASKPARKPFRRAFAPRPSAEHMARQASIAGEAWAALGDREAVMAFLNTHDDELGGRPLDLALASDEGLTAVRAAMAARARG
jgi:hypothetical protein